MHEGGCTIHIDEKLKQTRPCFHQQKLELPLYRETEHLCVVSCLKEYAQRTKELRPTLRGQLLLCYRPPHKSALKDSISRWLKTVLLRAGISDFTPHSFRSAATSAMKKSGVPLDEILKVAEWTKTQTFKKFIDKPVKWQNASNSILNYYTKKTDSDSA